MADRISQQELDDLWDFSDAEKSVRQLREAAADAPSGSVASAELHTQVARALGLQERFAEGDAELDSIDSRDGVVLARVLLERGRLRNSSGHPEDAIPLFEEALAAASAEGQDFLAVDAAHMLAIADSDRRERWTARALETVDETTDARTKRWAVSLHNNLGWKLFDGGNAAAALAEFELAADAARDFGTPQQRVWAQEAIDEVRAALDR
jgi:tetratricopeptide (TPR) repeat protein